MAIVVVGGSTKDVGKTALMCGVIAALKDFDWTAVKITAHEYAQQNSCSGSEAGPRVPTIWEETIAGEDTDTGRYLAAGARRALLITRRGPQIAIEDIQSALKLDRDIDRNLKLDDPDIDRNLKPDPDIDRNIIFESNRIMDVLRPDICVALVGGEVTQMKPSFVRLLRKADVVVSVDSGEVEMPQLSAVLPRFRLQSLDRLSPDLVSWLRSRLDESKKTDLKGRNDLA